MKLAHMAVVTPRRCGLYETTRELVVALRAIGVDSRIIDPQPTNLHPGGTDDRGAVFADTAWAHGADFLINHSGLGKELDASDIPVIHMAHGRPRSTFLTERDGGPPVVSYHYSKDKDPRFKAVITFWPEHVRYLQVMFTETPVHCITAPVDLDAWSPGGPSGYAFHGKKGPINVVIADAWRSDIDPFEAVCAFAHFARSTPAKLHLYGGHLKEKAWPALLRKLRDQDSLGEFQGWVSGLDNVYRAADMLITPHTIAVRSIREALACGCPVVRGISDIDNAVSAMRHSQTRQNARREAEVMYNPADTAREFMDIVNGCS